MSVSERYDVSGPHWNITVPEILSTSCMLGHKSIKNTLVYTHLVDFGGDEFVCKVAKNVDEAKTLVEGGFDYVTDIESKKLFRKRK